MTRYAQVADDDVCVNCGHERYEHRNWRCFAEHLDGTDCECEDATYVDASSADEADP